MSQDGTKSTDTWTKVGRGLAKGLGIELEDPVHNERVTRGESVFSVTSADTYVEEEPTVAEWLRQVAPTGQTVVQYFINLFPFLKWIGRYNLQWLIGDLIAGITVGAVVVPQSMAYAELAKLPVEFGLYSSFMGVLIYWFFATSKDITIGPVAVLSTVTGNVVIKAQEQIPDMPPWIVTSALAIICGGIVTFLGLVRMGWLVEFISLTAITAFMTGSAISIAAGQVPAMMGISGFSTRDATYQVIINTLKGLPRTNINAAMGLSALFLLYLIRFTCGYAARKQPHRAKLYFFLSTLRTAFVILFYTMISAATNLHRRDNPRFRILGNVPRGFQHAKVPELNSTIIRTFTNEIPAAVIVLLIEHISISKSFGRINNYTIDPSQELVAIGVTNLLGPFLGGYPATGSFSRTAIKSKSGVRTPFAGVITAIIVLLAIYALPAVFFYIPNASLSAVIIHAVGDLITPPNTVYQFWRISPLEVPIFFAGVFVTIFTSIENGIYTTIAISAAMLLFRMFKAKGRFLGKVKVHSVIGDHLLNPDQSSGKPRLKQLPKGDPEENTRNIFLPLDHKDGSNPTVEVSAPYPGIFIYRFSEGYNYPNANHYLDYLVASIFKETRRTDPHSYGRLGDRPWNDPGPSRSEMKRIDAAGGVVEDERPTLKAIILDFSSVNNVDVTSVQNLIDVRNQLDRYATPDLVDWHFACINNRWTKRALAAAGFGLPTSAFKDGSAGHWKPIFSVAEIGGSDSAAVAADYRNREDEENQRRASVVAALPADAVTRQSSSEDDAVTEALEKTLSSTKAYGTVKTTDRKVAVVHGLNRPLFHMDLTSALQAAIANIEGKTV
ncbi:sulfate permease-like protein [Eremomyces bilateralis CBS 781.70]|uniref:Sulfate permease-like protein n=1 Tax=Eremomyces bilateralis CBS 781.70 TaxID=1392243 RepID=A0A6G1G797_9PEZI|nr:sulfate permease-like protein [Eremomyces bilateralis CBS 781.70]KAF1813709.1 sulfate permease-like protein [Eremomyces bilateralis CBS 781.70]